MIIFGFMTLLAFDYFCNHAPFFDPGALIGFGVVGCISVICFAWRLWDGIPCVALCLLGGCFGTGMYRVNNNRRGGFVAVDGNGKIKAICW